MTLILVALGVFLLGVGVTALTARYFFLLGWEMARDDRALDPGPVVGTLPSPPSDAETTGPLRAVGESSGKHARPAWPSDEDTQVLPAVQDEVRA